MIIEFPCHQIIQKWLKVKLYKEWASSWLVFSDGCLIWPSSGSHLYLCGHMHKLASGQRRWKCNLQKMVHEQPHCLLVWVDRDMYDTSNVTSALFEIHLLPLVSTLVSCNCPSKIEDWNHKWFQMMCVCRARVASFHFYFSSGRGESLGTRLGLGLFTQMSRLLLASLRMAQGSGSHLNNDWQLIS